MRQLDWTFKSITPNMEFIAEAEQNPSKIFTPTISMESPKTTGIPRSSSSTLLIVTAAVNIISVGSAKTGNVDAPTEISVYSEGGLLTEKVTPLPLTRSDELMKLYPEFARIEKNEN